MSEKIQGRVEYINEREGKYGPMFSIKVDGTNYGVGKYPPRGVVEGDMVEFDVTYNGNWPNVARGTLRKVEGAASAPPRRQTSGGKPSSPKANSFDARQDVISKQAALNTALAFLELAGKHETIPVPKNKNQGYGYLRTLWMQEAAKLYELNTGNEWEMPEDVEDVEEEAPKPVRKATKKAATKKTAVRRKPAPEPEEEFEDDELPDFDLEDDPWE